MTAPRHLVGDIGGTHVRLAFMKSGGRASSRVTVEGDAYQSLAAAVQDGLAHLADRPAFDDAVLAVAGPVTGTRFRLTNRPAWTVEIDELRRAIGVARLTLVNDFAALALALPRLGHADSRPLGPALSQQADAPVAVLGAGTGLGVSAIVPCGDDWQPIAGEGGHVLLAANSEREAEILAAVRRAGVRTSGDRLLSGPGLSLIYAAVADLEPAKAPDAAAIANADNSYARETLALFASWLGSFAGDLALTLGARGGVYVGGGVVPKLGGAFPVDRFRTAFEAKGRLADYVAAIPTRLITNPEAGLLGASAALGRSGPGLITISA